nr:carboxypeptidase-like regulatory domain-containing protein [Corallococcus exercitus]
MDADPLSERLCPLKPPAASPPRQESPRKDCSFDNVDREYARLVEAREGEAPVLARTQTADDGTFVLEGLPPGALTLWALGDSGVGVQPNVQTGSDGVTLALEEGFFLSGGVVEQSSRAPIPGARVTVVHEAGSRFFDTLADDRGRFRVGPLPPGSYMRVASAKGWRATAFREAVWLDTDVDVTLELPKIVRLSGVVLTPEGLPASNVTVQLERDRHGNDIQTAWSDARGRFSFEEVPAIPLRLRAWTDDPTVFGDASVIPPEEIAFRLKRYTFIEGTVRDEQGHPLEGVRLSGGEPPVGGRSTYDATTDAAGHYRVGPVRKTDAFLRIHREHYQPETEFISLRQPHPCPWDFTLTPAVSFEGRVVDSEGIPLPGVELGLNLVAEPPDGLGRPRAAEHGGGKTDAGGRFLIDMSREGSGWLYAEAPDLPYTVTPFQVPTRELHVVIPGGRASVSGTVVDARGRPLSNVSLYLWDTAPERGHARTTTVDSGGAFTLKRLNAGRYHLEARIRTPGIEHSLSRPIALEEDTHAQVSLRFEEGRTVRGVTVDAHGQPVAGARLVACLPLEDIPAWQADAPACPSMGDEGVLSGPDGRFVFNHLRAPRYRLIAWKDGHAFAPALSQGGTPEPGALSVTAGAQDVRLVMERRPRITGRVVREDGTLLPCSIGEGSRQVRIPDGLFNLPLPMEGPQTFVVRAKGYFDLERRIVVRPGKDIDLGTLKMTRARTTRVIVLDEATHAPLAGVSVGIDMSDSNTSHPYAGPRPIPYFWNLDAKGSAEIVGLPFAPIVLYVRVEGASKLVTLDARQKTATVLIRAPEQ